MVIVFTGWERNKGSHLHDVIPLQHTVEGATHHFKLAGQYGDPLDWEGPLLAWGVVTELDLHGAYRMEFRFEEQEMRNWLLRYARSEPESAVRLLAEMHAEAVIALTRGRER